MIGKCFESLKSSFFNILSYIVLELVCPDLEFNYKFVAKIQKNKQTTINSLFLCCFDKTLGKNIRIHDFSPSVFLIAINFIIFAPSFGKIQAADILTKTLNRRLSAAIGISQILCCVVITQWSSSIVLVYIAYSIIPKAWADALLILHNRAMREPR